MYISDVDRIERRGVTNQAMRLICSGGVRDLIYAISLRLEQLFHDVCHNGIFALFLDRLTIRDVNTDPVFDLVTLEPHLETGK